MTLNEVRIQVRRAILDLFDFTVQELHDATGCKKASIYTELRRLREAGYLDEIKAESNTERKGPGAPQKRFRLTEDKVKLEELVRSVEKFYRVLEHDSGRPDSAHYETARKLIKQLEKRELSDPQLDEDLKRVDYHLELAAEDLGISIWDDKSTKLSEAFLDLLYTRTNVMGGHWDEADKYASQAQAVFETYHVEEGLERVGELKDSIDFGTLLQEIDVPEGDKLHKLAILAQKHPGKMPSGFVKQASQQVLRKGFDSAHRDRKGLVNTLADVLRSKILPQPLLMTIEEVLSTGGTESEVIANIERGTIKKNNLVEVIGASNTTCEALVKSIKSLGREINNEDVGARVALVLQPKKPCRIERGQVIARFGTVRPHRSFICNFYLPNDQESDYHVKLFSPRVKFRFRDEDFRGMFILSERNKKINPGANLNGRVALESFTALEEGQQFTLREGGTFIATGIVTKLLD